MAKSFLRVFLGQIYAIKFEESLPIFCFLDFGGEFLDFSVLEGLVSYIKTCMCMWGMSPSPANGTFTYFILNTKIVGIFVFKWTHTIVDLKSWKILSTFLTQRFLLQLTHWNRKKADLHLGIDTSADVTEGATHTEVDGCTVQDHTAPPQDLVRPLNSLWEWNKTRFKLFA